MCCIVAWKSGVSEQAIALFSIFFSFFALISCSVYFSVPEEVKKANYAQFPYVYKSEQ